MDIYPLLRGTSGKGFAVKGVPIRVVELGLTVGGAADACG